MSSEILSLKDRLSYRSWIVTLTKERILVEIDDLERQKQGNGELAESAQYHRNEWPNEFLASHEDYEHEEKECGIYLEICKSVLEEREEK